MAGARAATRARAVRSLLVATVFALATGACAASHHDTEPARLGTPVSSDAMLDVLAEPGPIRLEKIVAADWAVPRSGLVNLSHPRARAAGLEDGEEPIQIYFYAL
ncbi:MAG TPA: MBL fold metallo-hydrolase, partial [Alphaproteobacteria bacterium]|nr:MBL fold metallo-hydrolase [Alphaproteobacteria bacterium]